MHKIALVLAVASSVEAFSLFSHSKPAPAAGLRRSRNPVANLMEELFGASKGFAAPVVMGTEEMMSQKEFGTSAVPIQKELRWNCDVETADRICNYNRHYAEYGGYWERATTFLQEVCMRGRDAEIACRAAHLR